MNILSTINYFTPSFIKLTFYPLDIAALALVIFFSVAIIAVLLNKYEKFLINFSFSLAIIASVLLVIAGILAVGDSSYYVLTLNLGLPDLHFQMRLDPLAGFFLTTIGLLVLYVSIYSLGYVKEFVGHRPVARLIFFFALFVNGMFMVVLANDALFFLIAWELMAGSSYFLVLFEDEKPENKRAALLYLVIAHVGAIAILLSFGVMAGWSGGFTQFSAYTFDAMRASNFPVGWASLAFLLAFFGFSAKAGVIPLHIWLPEAHPVAPSNVSALMSGVMLKTAIYGIIRVAFDLIKVFPWWWGALVLVFGLVSAVLGVLYALMQHDLKRLLAYHSVENIGIILIGIGLGMMFTSFNMPVLAALAITAGIYHTLNHAMFKGLLFMGAGAVLHATKERDMEHMGGLIHLMPWTAFLFLIGCISISALPPFNGFVSEWLTFQAFLLSPILPTPLVKLIMPVGAAILALTGALAAACFVKAFGVTFLGNWRGKPNMQIKEVGKTMIFGMLLAAITCLLLGILPTFFISWMSSISQQLVSASINSSISGFDWLWLTPIVAERAAYSG
ncbi:MAG: hydrogenase 4 subunit B, partial [Candidatus Margulisbacteria bacterium]|nr:hydrogenase 4 subunit B [Candidatus Margulisiibacteriota bacterium]